MATIRHSKCLFRNDSGVDLGCGGVGPGGARGRSKTAVIRVAGLSPSRTLARYGLRGEWGRTGDPAPKGTQDDFRPADGPHRRDGQNKTLRAFAARSEERRVGKEGR